MPAPDNAVNKVTNNPEQVQEQPVRELSQTDHLNKKLLTSLFKRLDEGGEESLSKMMEPDSSDKPTEDEWAE